MTSASPTSLARVPEYPIGSHQSRGMDLILQPANLCARVARSGSGQVRRCRLHPPTVRFYFNCRHPAALPRTAGWGHKRSSRLDGFVVPTGELPNFAMTGVLLRVLLAPFRTGAPHVVLLGPVRIAQRVNQLAPDLRPSSGCRASHTHVLPHPHQSPSRSSRRTTQPILSDGLSLSPIA